MNPNSMRIVGIVLLVIGVVLLIMGINASHSVSDQLSNTVTGRYTDATMWYIVLGIIGIVAGAAMAFFSGRGRHLPHM